MEKYLKNPIILAIIVGAVIYMLMSYFYNPEGSEEKKSKKSKSKKKAKSGFFTDKRETTILVSSIAALGTWFLAKTYLVDSNESNVVDITGMNNNPPSVNVNPLVNSLLGPNAAGSEAGILHVNGRPGFADQQGFADQSGLNAHVNFNAQALAQPTHPGLGANVEIPVVAQPVAQPTIQNPAVQQIQNPAAEVVNNMDRANLNPVPQSGGGHRRSYNLIGTGLDLPRSAIPKVLVDYN